MGEDESRDVPPLVGEDHECLTCGMRYTDISVEEALAAVRSYPALYRRTLDDVPEVILRQRPEPATWSIIEYTCHVRDVYDVYTHRLLRAVTEDRPVLEPMHNERRVVRGRYDAQEPNEVLAALAGQTARFVAQAESITPGQYERVVTRLPGEDRTVRWLIRQASHEGLHHHHDIEQVRASLSGGLLRRRNELACLYAAWAPPRRPRE